jgi:hypothetical protein
MPSLKRTYTEARREWEESPGRCLRVSGGGEKMMKEGGKENSRQKSN